MQNYYFEKHFDKELSQQYGVDGLTACPMLKEGQEFYADWECLGMSRRILQ